ncbi:interferon-induced very large GTPase 1-like [Antedon mediterranea]|uniref:interferon-induced very large GTPase 1-like n=1 Tax=Antedon mediterranea TaxID=105859 RepID=UPI003AF5DC30
MEGKIKTLIKDLGLEEYYPRKLTREEVFKVSENTISSDDLNGDPRKIPWYMLQNVIICNYEGRSFDFEESYLFPENTAPQGKLKSCNVKTQVSPLDALVAIFLCCDNFFRQILIEKLSLCQIAIPLLMPVTDVPNKEWELIVWGMRTITKKWKMSSGSSCQKSMVVERLPIVSALRIGRPKISKSKIVNCIINKNHDIFINSGCKCGNVKRQLSNGLLEIAWYLPSQKSRNAFSDAVTFINLRRNASKFKSQTSFLSKISLVTIAFVSCADFNKQGAALLESLHSQEGKVIIILDGSKVTKTLKKIKKKGEADKKVQYMRSQDKNEVKISGEIRKLLGSISERSNQHRSIEECIEVAQRLDYHVDESGLDCLEAKQSAKQMLDCITNEGKQKELPLQMVTVQIGETKKEQHQLRNIRQENLEKYVIRLRNKVKYLRHQQLAKDQQRLECSTYNMFTASLSHSALKRKYFWAFVR